MNNTLWTPDDEKRLLELWDAGAGVQEISDELNRTAGAVLTRLYKHQRVYPQDDVWWVPRQKIHTFKEVKLMTDAYHERVKFEGEKEPAKR